MTFAFFRNLPIKRKMALALLGTTTIALLLACGTFVVYERANSRRAMARNLTVLGDALARNSGAALTFAEIQDTREGGAKILAALGAEPSVVAACLYTEDGSLHATYARSTAEANFPEKPEHEGTRIERDAMTVVLPVKDEGKHIGTIYLRANLTELNARLQLYAGISGLILVGSFLLALALASVLQRIILRPILALTDTATRIAESRDYTARAQKVSGDELGVLTDAFNDMLGQIQERTDAVQRANDSLREQAGEMREAAAVLAASASQILTSTTQLAASAAETASAITQTTTTVEEVKQTSQVSSDKAKYVSQEAQKAADVARGGKYAVDQTIEGMNSIRKQMEAVAESILSLSAQSQTIGEIISTVDDLAAQSKLLAVNAAIEAAKAGEEGKGFAVVAQEVRSLAEQSKQATTQVRTILNEIQKATGSAALATEQASKAVEGGVRQSAAAGESIGALAESIAGAAQASTQIAATSKQQLVGMDQVAMAMENIKMGSTQTVASTKQAETAAQQLHQLGQKLKELVARFKV